MTKIYYSDKEMDEFIEAAKEMGISPAMRALGYPLTYPTAVRWFDNKNVPRPDIDSLIQKACELKQFYGDKEKLYAVQTLIDRIVEKLLQDDLSADEINKLGTALNKAIQSFNLIEGKSTAITESRTKDATDLSIMDIVNATKAKNALKEAELS